MDSYLLRLQKILAMLLMSTMALSQAEAKICNPYSPIPCEGKPREKLAMEMALGFVKAIKKETIVWHECGVATPEELWVPRALKMANTLLDALDEFNVEVTPWGPWGVIFKESRGNRCAVGPYPRRAAKEKGILRESNWRLWTEDEVVRIMTHRRFRKRSADLGLGQVVWKDYARIKENGVERIPTLREMISMDTGMRVFAYEMSRRTKYKRGRKRWKKAPWIFWPGTTPHYGYASMIARAVRKMGGPHHKIAYRY